MPRGFPIPIDKRKEFVRLFYVEGLSASGIWIRLFDGNPDVIKLKTIERKCQELEEWTSEEVDQWVAKARENTGRQKYFWCQDRSDILLQVTRANFTAKLEVIRTEFIKKIFGNYEAHFSFLHVSTSTIARELHDRKWTRKILTRRNIRANTLEQVEYLREIETIDPNLLVNIDGIVHTAEDFLARYGWAPSGEEAKAVQLWINGKRYGIHAAYCRSGFIAWAIFEGNITQSEVSYFIHIVLKAALQRYGFTNAFAILDNASNQSTDLVHNSLQSVFGCERYKHLPAYSPFLAPIEHGFANIRTYVHEHESRGIEDPLGLIHEAFQTYSVGTERGHSAFHHFDCYDHNFQENMED
jgi:hypothetical protein